MEGKQNQEVDMIGIVKDTTCYFSKKIGQLLTQIIRLTYSYFILLVVLLLVAVGLAYFFTNGNNKTYVGDLSIKLNAGTSYMVADLMSELNRFIRNNDSEGLAEALGIKEEEAEKISYINSYYYIAINKDSTRAVIDYDKHYDMEDTVNTVVKNQLVISVGMNDKGGFNKIQETLINYINNNDYLKKLHNKRLADLQERDAIITCDLNRLDSLQKRQFFSNSKNDIYLTNMTEIHSGKQDLFYIDKQNLLDKKEELEATLTANTQPITILNPIHPTSVSHVSFIKLTIRYCLLAYVIFLIISAIVKNRKEIHKFMTKE